MFCGVITCELNPHSWLLSTVRKTICKHPHDEEPAVRSVGTRVLPAERSGLTCAHLHFVILNYDFTAVVFIRLDF